MPYHDWTPPPRTPKVPPTRTMTPKPTFKRARNIVGLHYGSTTNIPRKLCQLFRTEHTSKQEAIIDEATRILDLRRKAGYIDRGEAIDATMRQQVETLNRPYVSNRRPNQKKAKCLVCKKPVSRNGWQVTVAKWCAGDCTVVANFYYTKTGGQKSPCQSFKAKYGRAPSQLSPSESFDAMLSYMAHLSANRAT